MYMDTVVFLYIENTIIKHRLLDCTNIIDWLRPHDIPSDGAKRAPTSTCIDE